MKPFDIIPAIDLRAGRVVRLFQGDYARQTDYAVTPQQLAESHHRAGARWLHVVDLDGAREGTQVNLAVIADLAGRGFQVQAGGGIRDETGLRRLLDAGVARVVVGSLAVREPERVLGWLRHYGPERITLALDTRWREGAWRLASAGWTAEESLSLDDLGPRYVAAGARHVLCTDIDRDGTLAGPNLALYAHLREVFPAWRVQASGGVRNLDDVRAVRATGSAGVILGRALLEGHLPLAEALAVTDDGKETSC